MYFKDTGFEFSNSKSKENFTDHFDENDRLINKDSREMRIIVSRNFFMLLKKIMVLNDGFEWQMMNQNSKGNKLKIKN